MIRFQRLSPWIIRGGAAIVFLAAGVLVGQTMFTRGFHSLREAHVSPGLPIGVTGGAGEPAEASRRIAATPGVIYQTFAGQDFRAVDPGGTKVKFTPGGQVAVIPGTTSENHFLSARLNLPQGARVIELVFYYVRETNGTIVFRLARYDPSAASVDYPLTLTAGETVKGEVQSVYAMGSMDAPLAVIDNAVYQYSLEYFPSPGSHQHNDALRLSGARIGYVLPTTYIPVVSK
jgi:hypothetical protein